VGAIALGKNAIAVRVGAIALGKNAIAVRVGASDAP
jgi:hypothetical protein